ncbi:MAG: PAS domain S-box protein [Burkholderiales bacterium]
MPFTELTRKPLPATAFRRGLRRISALFSNPRVALLAAALVFAVAVLVAAELAVREEAHTVVRNVERQTEILALALRDRFTTDLVNAESTMQLLLLDLPQSLKPEGAGSIVSNLSGISKLWDRYAVFNMDGAMLFRGAAFETPLQQIKEHLQEHAKGEGVIRIGGSRKDSSGDWRVDVSLRATDSAGKTVGFVLGSINLAAYRQSQAEMQLGDGAVLQIITRGGRIVSRIDDDDVSSGQEIGDDHRIRGALELSEGCHTGTMNSLQDGTQRISSFCPFAAYPLVAMASARPDLALTVSNTIALRYRQIAYVLLALLAVGTGFMLHVIRRQQLMQHALQGSESRFRALSALGSDWYWESDRQYRFTSISDGLSRLTGRAEEEFSGKAPWELDFCIPSGTDWVQHKAVIARSESFRDFSLRYLSPQGAVAYASVSGEPVFDQSGQLAGYRGVGRDITTEVVLRQRLGMQHDVTRALSAAKDANSAVLGVIQTICRTMEWGWGAHRHIDLQTMILTCPAYWLAPGVNAQPFVEFAVIPKPADPENGTVSRAIMRNEIVWFTDHTGLSLRRSAQAHAAGLRGAIAVPVPRARGVEDALEFFSARVEAPDQIMLDTLEAIGREVGQFLDHAEAQQTSVTLERERRHLVEMLQLQLQHMPIACLIQDRDFRIVYVNPAAERTFGYTLTEMQGRDTARFLVPESGLELLRERRVRVRAGDMNVTGTNENIMKGGRIIICRWSITPLTDEQGVFSGALAVAQDVSEQVKMIAALEESEEHYRQIFASAPLPMWVADVPVPRLLAVNDATVRTYGYSREELLHMTAIDLQVVEDRERVLAELAAIDSRLPARFNRRHLTRDGRVILAEVYAQPFHSGGRTARLVVVNNVTEQKQAQQALEESEARFRAFFEQASVGMAVREVSHMPRFLRVNRKLCEILGYDEDELLLMSSLDITPEEDQAETQEYNVQLRNSTLRSYSRQKRYRRKDGRIIWVELSVAAVEGADGKPQYLISVIQDITEQINAARMLRESERRVALALSSSGGALFDWNVVTGEVYLSDQWNAMLGGDAREMHATFTEMTELVHPDDREEQRNTIVQLLKVGTVPYQAEFRVRTHSGSWLWVESRASVTERDRNGRAVRVLGTNIDITRRKQTELALRERDVMLRDSAEEIRKLNAELERRVEQRTRALAAANRDLESFSYSVSHDLRAPLRTIDGFSQILLQEHAGSLDETGRGYLERLRAGSQRMARLIDDLLELARVTRRDLNIRDCDLTLLAREIAQDLQRAEPERNVEFIVAEGMTVTADPGLMRIAMDNLIRNAWKFTGRRDQGVIRIGCIIGDGETTYFVNDNGVGFDMAYASKLFAPFQRLHSEAEFEGTGIGLAMVQRVVRRHGGDVRAEAEPDRGATFFIMLPQQGTITLPGGFSGLRAAI